MTDKPMRVMLHSDLHKEFYNDTNHQFKWFFKPPKMLNKEPFDGSTCDVCVLAGDIVAANCSLEFIDAVCDKVPHVIHVAGNHEHYKGRYETTIERHREHSAKRDNYHFLERDTLELDGKRFVGCTMWYPGNANRNTHVMNDFYLIRRASGTFGDFVFDYAKESVQWLYDTVQPGDIVVTHMLPSYSCVDQGYHGNHMNGYYVNPADDVIRDKKPAAWLHGHSHSSLDMKLIETRCLRNPKGYPHDPNHLWQTNFCVEL